MPQPCSQPLSTNPFESYRDPVTGQWKVKYPDSALSVKPPAAASQSIEEKKQRSHSPRRWQKPARSQESSHTRVA